MSGKRRSNGQLARDRRRIADLYLQGELQADIAVQLKIDQSTVSRDIAHLQAEWRKSALVDIDARKSQELAKVDRLEREYWAAWERSCEDAETATQKQRGKVTKAAGEDGQFVAEQPAEISKTRKGQAGDPRFLSGIQWCIERRCKILGIDAPEKHKHSGTGEDGAIIFQFTDNLDV
jgi:hypothetical protein